MIVVRRLQRELPTAPAVSPFAPTGSSVTAMFGPGRPAAQGGCSGWLRLVQVHVNDHQAQILKPAQQPVHGRLIGFRAA
jgi:hypothetical protein